MAAVPPGPFQEGRRRALFWSLRSRGGVAPDLEFHAKEIWRPDFWTGFADGAGIEVGDLPGADAIERDQRGPVSRAHRAGVRVFGRAFARDDHRGGRRNAQGR